MPFEQDARVVVVDDDPLFVEAMLVLLPQLGLEPIACALDGAEAIAVAKEHDPDLVLVDLDMPLVDGIEAIREISRASPKPMSSAARSAFAARCRAWAFGLSSSAWRATSA